MAILTEWVRYDGHLAYRAYPELASAPLPGVIVIQEAFGVDAHIEDVARRIAAAGYVALAPDLFSEGGTRPGPLARDRFVEILAWVNTKPVPLWIDPAARAAALAAELKPDHAARIEETIGEMMKRITKPEQFFPKLQAAASYLRTKDALARGTRVGAIGFCMGGGLTGWLACADPELACAVVFYGSAPPPERVAGGRCPVLGLYGADDPRINPGVPAFAEAMARAGRRFEQQVYEATPHAFFNDSRPSYRQAAARDAFVRTLGWLRDHLT